MHARERTCRARWRALLPAIVKGKRGVRLRKVTEQLQWRRGNSVQRSSTNRGERLREQHTVICRLVARSASLSTLSR